MPSQPNISATRAYKMLKKELLAEKAIPHQLTAVEAFKQKLTEFGEKKLNKAKRLALNERASTLTKQHFEYAALEDTFKTKKKLRNRAFRTILNKIGKAEINYESVKNAIDTILVDESTSKQDSNLTRYLSGLSYKLFRNQTDITYFKYLDKLVLILIGLKSKNTLTEKEYDIATQHFRKLSRERFDRIVSLNAKRKHDSNSHTSLTAEKNHDLTGILLRASTWHEAIPKTLLDIKGSDKEAKQQRIDMMKPTRTLAQQAKEGKLALAKQFEELDKALQLEFKALPNADDLQTTKKTLSPLWSRHVDIHKSLVTKPDNILEGELCDVVKKLSALNL